MVTSSHVVTTTLPNGFSGLQSLRPWAVLHSDQKEDELQYASNHTPRRLEQLGAASAGIVHDLNNQLMLILNHLETGNVPGARRAVQQCAGLTGNLLDYCRDARPSLLPLDLSRFVAMSAESLSVPPSIQLRLELDTGNPRVLADGSGLTRILHNLVSNAIVAMQHRGAITITVAGSELRVADTGPGVPSEARKRIFEPFFTTKQERTEEGGTGLGLAIVREIMRQHGGSIRVGSEPGYGAVFTLQFRKAPIEC